MVIFGAKGHALEIFQCFENYNDIHFFDDIDENLILINDKFKVYKSITQVKEHFKFDKRFILGLGRPDLRRFAANKFLELGGVLHTVIASTAIISNSAVLCDGLNIMHFSFIAPNTSIGEGTLINSRASIHHDVKIGEYCEISPGAIVLGRSVIGPNTSIGAGAIILPDIQVGAGSVIGAGAVVTKNVSQNETVVGIPAKPLNYNS